MTLSVSCPSLKLRKSYDCSKVNGSNDDSLSILVTGCAGFIGSNVCRLLLQDGQTVYADFKASLTVLTTVVSSGRTRGQVTVDAGIKAFATDSSRVPEAKGREGLAYRRFGDEFGRVTAAAGADLPRLGERLEFIIPHCDPTVNLYDRIYAMRGERMEDIWPIAARREFVGA